MNPIDPRFSDRFLVSDEVLARRYGVTLGDILHWCVEGRLEGAFYHRLNRCWYIPEPVRYRHVP